jgi:MFS transporter, ACS family, glucarate transporter
MNPLPGAPAARPTRVRYGVLTFVCLLSMITYLDRAAIGSAGEYIYKSLGYQSIDDIFLALAAFNLAYALFEVPTGWLGDVYGPRKTLIRIVLWWSAFTMLTGLTGLPIGGTVFVGFWTLVLIRFLFGVGEAGAYPNITRALHNWIPQTERGRAQGLVWMSGRLTGGLTPLLWGLLLYRLGLSWNATFFLFGAVGLVWCVAFAAWFRNRPEEHPEVNAAERELIRAGTGSASESAHKGVPWGSLLRSRNLWALCLMYACTSYPWYFFLSYLPNFLQEQYGVERESELGGLAKGGPLILGALGCWVGGWLTDAYVRRTGDRRWGRRLFGLIGHGLCVPLFLLCLAAPNGLAFAAAVAAVGFCNDLTMGSSWAVAQDIGRRHAAIVAGCMNMVGNLGGFLGTYFSGVILRQTKLAYATSLGLEVKQLTAEQIREGMRPGYAINFMIYAGVYVLATLFWLRIDATKPVLAEDAA